MVYTTLLDCLFWQPQRYPRFRGEARIAIGSIQLFRLDNLCFRIGGVFNVRIQSFTSNNATRLFWKATVARSLCAAVLSLLGLIRRWRAKHDIDAHSPCALLIPLSFLSAHCFLLFQISYCVFGGAARKCYYKLKGEFSEYLFVCRQRIVPRNFCLRSIVRNRESRRYE